MVISGAGTGAIGLAGAGGCGASGCGAIGCGDGGCGAGGRVGGAIEVGPGGRVGCKVGTVGVRPPGPMPGADPGPGTTVAPVAGKPVVLAGCGLAGGGWLDGLEQAVSANKATSPSPNAIPPILLELNITYPPAPLFMQAPCNSFSFGDHRRFRQDPGARC